MKFVADVLNEAVRSTDLLVRMVVLGLPLNNFSNWGLEPLHSDQYKRRPFLGDVSNVSSRILKYCPLSLISVFKIS